MVLEPTLVVVLNIIKNTLYLNILVCTVVCIIYVMVVNNIRLTKYESCRLSLVCLLCFFSIKYSRESMTGIGIDILFNTDFVE